MLVCKINVVLCDKLLMYVVLLDIDECSNDNHGCDQVCTNTPGAYQCSCSNHSYQLSSDGKTCIGNVDSDKYRESPCTIGCTVQ